MESKRFSKKKSFQISRRDFLGQGLKVTALTSVAGAAVGCSTMDRLIMGDYLERADRVVIVGAGLAGLMAAYQLKLRQIPYQIFEASNRIGGRVYTVPEFLRGQPNAELGGEWISPSHKTLFDLAKDLRVEIVEAREFANPKLRRLGQLGPAKSLNKELSRLQTLAIKAGAPGDLVSLSEWIKKLSTDTFFIGLLNDWSLERFGAQSSQVRASAFSNDWLKARQNPLAPWTEARFRIRNGSSSLANALYDRVGGYQPSMTFKREHRLRSVRNRGQNFELSFEIPQGETTVNAKYVICAIPQPVLSGIDGLSQVGGDGFRQNGIGTGYHSKFLFSYAERFWAGSLDQSKVLQFGPGQVLSESSFRGNPLFQFRQGTLSLLWGGEPSKLAGLHTVESLKKEIPAVLKTGSNPQPMDSILMNWEKATLFQGSVSYPQVGQQLSMTGPESPAGWIWAGEHLNASSPGTMDAALKSGVAAVEQILRQNEVLSGKSPS